MNHMTMGEINRAIKHEYWWLKILKLISALLIMAIAITCCVYFTKQYMIVQDLQPHCVDFIKAQNATYVPYCTNSTYYDMDFGFTNGPFTNDVEAKHYQYLLSNCFFECRSHGTRWSMIYISGAIITGAHIFQSILITLGIWISCLRFFALFFQFFCSLGLITLCIIMASFRYNSIG